MTKRTRCAIYTRKSSDDGLDQEFNSLDAQREACEAFIKSQRGLGWMPLPNRYDDGGQSGGTMDRPALQTLLEDIHHGKVDLVVVYKVDRLTRSLADFAKIVEIFDARSVSFVSVTQQFNTTTSMGRLTLNMLLSFAQFEREVTAERIRDKIAASKQKGMWMGGLPPLGYDLKDKKLVINTAEAASVKVLFRQYLTLNSVAGLQAFARRRNIRTKRRRIGDRTLGGRPFTRGHLHQILRNPVYVGRVTHKGKVYEGQHVPIVDRTTWENVQKALFEYGQKRSSKTNLKGDYLLSGLLFDEAGVTLSTHYAMKNGRRYRYYVSKAEEKTDGSTAKRWRLPAEELERVVIDQVCALLNDRSRLLEALSLVEPSLALVGRIFVTASDANARLIDAGLPERRQLIRDLISRVTLTTSSISIEIFRAAITRRESGTEGFEAGSDEKIIHIKSAIEVRKRGVEAKLVIGNNECRAPDEALIELLSRSHRWLRDLTTGAIDTVRQIASRDGVDETDVSRFLPLAFLAPDVVSAILEGRQPPELTVKRLRQASPLPLSWADQRRRLGFKP